MTTLMSTLVPTGAKVDTDYQETGKTYPAIQAFLKDELLTTSNQFESCKSFKGWLLTTYEICEQDLTCYYKRDN